MDRDERGVSTVVSAVLVFGLITVVTVIYTATVVRDQVEDAEADHMRRVSADLGEVADQISSAVALDTEGEVTVQMDLGTTSLPFLSTAESAGTLSVEDDGFVSSFKCATSYLISREGVASPGATPAAITGTPVSFVNFHVLEVHLVAYTFGAGNDSATFTFTSSGNPLATFTVKLEGASKSIRVTTVDGAGRTVVDQTVATGLTALVPSYRINALDPLYGLDSLLQDAQTSSSLTMSTTSAGLQVFAAYWTTDGSMALVGQGRLLVPGYQRGIHSYSLVYRSDNQRFLDQTYAFQGGALVLSQPTGEYLNQPPFSMTIGPQKLLRYNLVNVTGTGTVSGTHRATVFANIEAPSVSVLDCSGIEIVVQTSYVNAWNSSWADALLAVGLDPAQTVASPGRIDVNLAGPWLVVVNEARSTIRIS